MQFPTAVDDRLLNNYTTSPSFLRADSQRGAAELTIARRSLMVLV